MARYLRPKVPKEFYVYTHARPSGSIFYVGKGHGRRAWDMAPSRRTAHHRNIVNKYGLHNIIVTVYPQDTEDKSFEEEIRLIKSLRDRGVALINITSGGEGAAGRKMSEKQKAALARGRSRLKNRPRTPTPAMISGWQKAQAKIEAWRQSPEGKAHIKRLVQASLDHRKSVDPWPVVCRWCSSIFVTTSAKARYCNRLCNQEMRRHKMEVATPYLVPRSNNSSGYKGVYLYEKIQKWRVMLGVDNKLEYFGEYASKREAVAIRHEAVILLRQIESLRSFICDLAA